MPPSLVLPRTCQTALAGLVICLAACKTAPPPPPPEPEPVKKPAGLYEWKGQGKNITSIKINVDEQKARLYHGEDEIGWTYVASGITSFPTPVGEFKILEKVADKVSNLYGKGYDANGKLVNSDFKQGRDLLPPGGRFEAAKMTYFMRLTGDGVGMHIGPIPRPGRRASHGCIRLPSGIAGTMFRNTSVGTPVTITGSGPDYKTYLKQSAEKAKANAAKLAASKKKAEEEAAKALAEGSTPPAEPPAANGAPPSTVTTALPADAPVPAPLVPATPAPPPAPSAPIEEIRKVDVPEE
ncbi:MAG TPA: hypothetical protein DIT13_10265 [Verrucomicrobiales bacterium]|nr:hypothetical protein [Verrucomicrobiales bacterium]HRJ08305.1 L,D-transpeptidase [Prosthecobacter sp.]HRK14924.1 L,D-transpeptidase [Prosthecobacter sp.]